GVARQPQFGLREVSLTKQTRSGGRAFAGASVGVTVTTIGPLRRPGPGAGRVRVTVAGRRLPVPGEDLYGVHGALAGAVRDLVAAREARRGRDALVLAHGGEQALLADRQRQVVVGVAERAGHAAAAGVEDPHVVGDPAEHGRGVAGAEDRLLLAVAVEQQRLRGARERPLRLEPARRPLLRQELLDHAQVLGHGLGGPAGHEVGVVVAEHRHARRLDAEHGHALADVALEAPDVLLGHAPRLAHQALRELRPAAAAVGDELDPVAQRLEDGHRGLARALLVVARPGVDEQRDPPAVRAGGSLPGRGRRRFRPGGSGVPCPRAAGAAALRPAPCGPAAPLEPALEALGGVARQDAPGVDERFE